MLRRLDETTRAVDACLALPPGRAGGVEAPPHERAGEVELSVVMPCLNGIFHRFLACPGDIPVSTICDNNRRIISANRADMILSISQDFFYSAVVDFLENFTIMLKQFNRKPAQMILLSQGSVPAF